jgi:hypothetical protein
MFGFENKHNKQSLKIDPGTPKKLGMLNVIKQLQHFILCSVYLLLRDDFHIGLVISPRAAVLAFGNFIL